MVPPVEKVKLAAAYSAVLGCCIILPDKFPHQDERLLNNTRRFLFDPLMTHTNDTHRWLVKKNCTHSTVTNLSDGNFRVGSIIS